MKYYKIKKRKSNDIYVTALDDNGNKIRKQVKECVDPDKQTSMEFYARKTLSKYTDKSKAFKKIFQSKNFMRNIEKITLLKIKELLR